jgi:urease accessory protein
LIHLLDKTPILMLPPTYPLVMALGGALGVTGVPIPGIEFGIAASALIIAHLDLLADQAASRSCWRCARRS